MIDLDDELRHTLQDLAGRGEPPALGHKAIQAVRRRQHRSLLAAGAAAAAIVVALIPMLLGRIAPNVASQPMEAPSNRTVSGSNVVAAYADQANRWHLLDKVTGTYVALPTGQSVRAVSPTLDWVATSDRDGQLSISATAKGTVPRKLIPPIGFQYGQPVFSPDHRYLAVPMAEPSRAAFQRVQVMELANLSFTVVELPLSANRGATAISWWKGNLLVATRGISGESARENVTYLGVSLAGAAILDRQVPAGMTEPGSMSWADTGLVRDDTVVVIQRLEEQVSLALHDLGPRQRLLTRSVTLNPPPLANGQTTIERVLGWRSPSEIVVAQWVMEMPKVVSTHLVVVNLDTGAITPAPFPVPTNAKEVIVLDATGLDPAIAPTLRR